MELKEAIEILEENENKVALHDFGEDYAEEALEIVLQALEIVLQALEQKGNIEFKLQACEQEHNYDAKMIDKLKGEVVALNKNLEEKDRQLKYLRSGKYYKQLRWERDMLQKIVDTGKLSEFDKEWLDFAHRNTELLKELKEKSRIIDLMTEYIADCDNEEMCSAENEDECDNGEHCKICVQRYFKKKVEESNEKL